MQNRHHVTFSPYLWYPIYQARTGDETMKIAEGRAQSADISKLLLRSALSALLTIAACKQPEKQQPIGDSAHGKQLIEKYGCASCHVIPKIDGPKGMVGPPLEHIASRRIIGAKLTNTPQNMMAWLQNPQMVDPNNSMPNLGVTPADARDITAFLETLK